MTLWHYRAPSLKRMPETESGAGLLFPQPEWQCGTLKGVFVTQTRPSTGKVAALGLLALGCCTSHVAAQATAPVTAGSATALPAAPAPTAEAIRAYEQALPATVTVAHASGAPLPLSLDEAIARGLRQNLQIALSRQNEERVRGGQSTAVNALLPTLKVQAYTNTQEINLAAMGFKPSSLGALLGPSAATTFSSIVKVDVTSAQLNLNQQLFNVPAFYLYRASQKARSVATLQTLNTRGGVVLQVGQQYLTVLADAAQIANLEAQVQSDQAACQQARDRQQAGVGVHLDTLRAQVQLQTEQQTLISEENTYAKDKIQLNRLMGAPVEQVFVLSDTTPFADLAMLPQNITLEYAFTKRKDLLSLEAQLEVAREAARAVRFERLPTVAMGGYYGVLGETHGLYHGVFTAQGSVNFPIFKEAQFRGETEVAQAQLLALRQQIDSLRATIDQQVRSNMLDVQSSNDLVAVARSNVELAKQELADSLERAEAGVSDNLPSVVAQATLASAQSQLVQQLFRYNTAKLQLARSVGVTESEYKSYLGK